MDNKRIVESIRTLHPDPTAEEYNIVLQKAAPPKKDPPPKREPLPQKKPSPKKDPSPAIETVTGQQSTPAAPLAKPKKKAGAGRKFLLFVIVLIAIIAAFAIGKSVWKKNAAPTEVLYNYYTSDIGSHVPVSSECRYNSDKFITNIESGSGDLVGDSLELLVIPWQEKWQRVNGFDWGLGSLRFHAYCDDGEREYRYFYDNTYANAQSAYKAETLENPFEYLAKRISSSETVEINGHTYLYYYRIREIAKESNAIDYCYLEDKDGYGVLNCTMTYYPEDGKIDDSLTKFVKFRSEGVSILQHVTEESDFADVTAASPFSDKTIVDSSDSFQTVIACDHNYLRKLSGEYKTVTGATDDVSYRYDNLRYSYYYSPEKKAKRKDMTYESVSYEFRDMKYRNAEEESQETGYHSLEKCSNIDVGDIWTFTSSYGYEVNVRLITYDYYDDHYQTLYMWLNADEKTALWIENTIRNAPDGTRIDEKKTAERLADSIRISPNEDPQFDNERDKS